MESGQPRKPFRELVAQEHRAQLALRAQGTPIPRELKKYARQSGGVLFLLPLLGSMLFWFLFRSTGYVSVTFSLLFVVLSLVGLFQLITGRHVMTRK